MTTIKRPEDMSPYSFTIAGFRFAKVATGDSGVHSGRPRYRVTCVGCGGVAHENTTGPEDQARFHLWDVHGFRVPLV